MRTITYAGTQTVIAFREHSQRCRISKVIDFRFMCFASVNVDSLAGSHPGPAHALANPARPFSRNDNRIIDRTSVHYPWGSIAESFEPSDVKYFNWRFIMKNNVEANPPISPLIQSFAVAYRLEPR